MAYEFKKKNAKKEAGSSFDDAAMGKRVKQEQERYKLATDSEFWSCLCFKTEKDMQSFIAKTGLPDRRYVLGSELREATEPFKPTKKLRAFGRKPMSTTMLDDPLESVDYSECGGRFEQESAAEAMAIFNAFNALEKQDKYAEATDSHFWICVVFDSRDDAERYLDDMNLRKHGDKYIDASAWLKELR